MVKISKLEISVSPTWFLHFFMVCKLRTGEVCRLQLPDCSLPNEVFIVCLLLISNSFNVFLSCYKWWLLVIIVTVHVPNCLSCGGGRNYMNLGDWAAVNVLRSSSLLAQFEMIAVSLLLLKTFEIISIHLSWQGIWAQSNITSDNKWLCSQGTNVSNLIANIFCILI